MPLLAPHTLDKGEAYDQEDLEALARTEDSHFWLRARRRIIVDALRRWFPNTRSYLEVGCGSGYVTRGIATAFPAWRIAASEQLRSGITIAERNLPPAVDIFQLDLRHMPFEGEFDLVGAYDVIEHIEDHAGALGGLYRALRPGGGILLTVPQHGWLWSEADNLAHHYRRYTAAQLKRLVEAEGFQVVAWTSFNTVNLPLLLLRSWLGKASRGMTAASTPARPINWLLERSMDLDAVMIRAGVRLPLGGSLMLAAHRT